MPNKKTIKTEKTQVRPKTDLKTEVYNLSGEIVGKLSLPGEIFAVKGSNHLLAQAVRVYQANKRLGTHDSKTRSEVVGSTRKIYRQKGTGRARHGSITAPIFVGGGVAHGPHPRDYSLTLPQKMKKAALFAVLSDKLHNGSLKVVRGFEKIALKTKIMNETLNNLKFNEETKKKENILLITSENLKNIILSGRNIDNLTIENVKLLNTLKVISHRNLLLMEEAVPVLASHFLSQNKQKLLSGISTKKEKVVKKSASTKNRSAKKEIKPTKKLKAKK
ncbi:50S ribosomal protein L4 [Candidatus Gottesmanbacteria bacterium]|nr:50S ribosomal protein L4 [Candidatus Gottesmanbacteria bacterium]